MPRKKKESTEETKDRIIDLTQEGRLKFTEFEQTMLALTSSNETQALLSNVVKEMINYFNQIDSNTLTLFEKAITDDVTNLKRRGYFMDVLRREIKQKQNIGYIITDIDNFKNYSTIYGYLQGDRTLITVADVVSRAVGKDDVVGRYGGEEFGVVLLIEHNNNNNDVTKLAEKIRKRVEDKVARPFSVKIMAEKCLIYASEECDVELSDNVESRLLDILFGFYNDKKTYHTSQYEDKFQYFFGKNGLVIGTYRNGGFCDLMAEFNRGFQKVTISLGAATHKEGETIEELIYRTGVALQQAKDKGRNRVETAL